MRQRSATHEVAATEPAAAASYYATGSQRRASMGATVGSGTSLSEELERVIAREASALDEQLQRGVV